MTANHTTNYQAPTEEAVRKAVSDLTDEEIRAVKEYIGRLRAKAESAKPPQTTQ